MEILSQPDALSLSGNIKDFLIASSEIVRLRLYRGGELLLDNRYTPDADDRVKVSIKDTVHSNLSFRLTSGDSYSQDNLFGDFTAMVDDTAVSFRVVKCGVANLHVSAAAFLTGNFLTWQPQVMEVRHLQPQWLTYYNASGSVGYITVRMYLQGGGHAKKALATVAAGACVTVNTQFAHIWGITTGDRLGYYDVAVEDSNGNTMTYVQRYILSDNLPEDRFFLFENTLGGIDCAVFTGENVLAPASSYVNVQYDEEFASGHDDTQRLYSQNTGFKTAREILWLKDFWGSKVRYVIESGQVRSIVLNESSVSASNMEQLNAFTFTYKFSEDSGLQNLPRVEAFAEPLQITTPDEVFFLAPRLSEFLEAELQDFLQIPVQSPYTESWYKITIGALKSYIQMYALEAVEPSVHFHSNKKVLDQLTQAFINVLQLLEVDSAGNLKVRDGSDVIVGGKVISKDGFRTKNYVEGIAGAGAAIKGDGTIEGDSVTARKKLLVGGPAEFMDNLSSEEFISGFLGGKGWAILKQEILNALGIPETKYTAEFDNVVVRGVLRVFSFVVSQMLGENDNRVFTGMLEVDHYDAESGRVYLRTQDGKLYNPFRAGDYIMVQQYNGMPSEDNNYYITKHYELIVSEAGIGDMADGENRLDWVTFSNFTASDGTTAADLITAGDTFVRVDNASDPDRKGIIQMMTVGTATPYMDIIYGLKTDPGNALKGRLGNLKGLQHHLFGWLQGFGELLQNLYAVGDFRLRRTGESLDAKIEMLKEVFATAYQRVNYDLTEEDNYLKNATFTESLDGWSCENDFKIITENGEPLLVNGELLTTTGKTAKVEEYDGRRMLHLVDSYVRQANDLIRKPGTHKEYIKSTDGLLADEAIDVQDTLYLTIKFLARTSGTLAVGMEGAGDTVGALPFTQAAITSSFDWQIFQWSGTWDGMGDFLLQYSGDMYVSLLALTARPLDEFKKSVSTRIEQTDSNIRLLGTNVDNLKGTVTQLGIDLDAAEERITIYANKVNSLEGTTTQLGVRLDAAESSINIYATKVDNLSRTVTQLGIDLDAAEEQISIYAGKVDQNSTDISQLKVTVNGISSTVTSVQGDLEAAKKTAAAASAAAQARADEAAAAAGSAALAAANAQNAADGAQSTADAAWAKSLANATAINQNADSISAIAGKFDSNGKLIEGSGWVTTSSFAELYSLYEGLDGKMSTKASVSTSVQYNPETGLVTSNIKITADKIKLEGITTINDSFQVDTDGTTRIAGFRVSGNGLTNRDADGNYTNDAYVIFRNDAHKCFAGIGGNVFPATTGVRGVARFENHDTTDQWGFGANYAILVSAQGARDNVALAINGGSIYGFAMKNTLISSTTTSKYLTRTDYNVIALNSNDCTVVLPTMELYDDGHVIRIKKLGGGKVNIRMSSCYTWSGTSYRYTTPVLVYNRGATITGSNTLAIENTGESCEFVWCRDVNYTIDNTSYYGAWVQYKHPRDW